MIFGGKNLISTFFYTAPSPKKIRLEKASAEKHETKSARRKAPKKVWKGRGEKAQK